MDPKNLQEFDLDDILREFGSEPEPEEILQEFSPRPTAPPDTLSGDTVRLDHIQKAAKAAPVSSDTAVFTPAHIPAQPEPEEAPPAPVPTPPPAAEPFSDDWEPEYDEPMGEYEAPIPFPQSRRRILRQKLVAGPEQRYYELAQAGLVKLQLGIFLSVILFAMSAAGSVMHEMGLISPQRLGLLIFGQLVLAMLAALLGCYRMMEGAGSLLRGRFTLNTLLLITFIACMVDGIACLGVGRMPYATPFCLEMLMAQWSSYQKRNTEMSQMDTLRKASDLFSLVKIPDYYEGRPGYVAAQGEPEAFMDHYRTPSAPEKLLSLFGCLSLVVSAALAVMVGALQGVSAGVQTLAAAMLMATPATAFISMSRPAAILEQRLHRLGAVICGWEGIAEAEKKAVYPLTHEELFPEGTTKMNGVKFYGAMDPGRVVSYTTALIAADGTGLLPVFGTLPRSRSSRSHHVTEFTAYPNGIGGLVDGTAVIVGTAEFMAQMGVELPDGSRVAQAVYTAMEGQLSGVFAVTYSRSRNCAAGLRTLCADRNLTPVLTSCDFILTPRFIRSKLSVNVRRMVFPERAVRQALAQAVPQEDAPVIALTVQNTLASKAFALNGARALHTALKTGAWIHVLGGLLGLLIVTILSLLHAAELLSPVNLLLYGVIWMLPGLLITEGTRYI